MYQVEVYKIRPSHKLPLILADLERVLYFQNIL